MKQPYINLFFKLTHQAPKNSCVDFNHLVSKREYSAKINPVAGLIIEAWVRKPKEIENSLKTLKESVSICTQKYIEKIEARIKASANTRERADEGEQGRLNKIIAALHFDV